MATPRLRGARDGLRALNVFRVLERLTSCTTFTVEGNRLTVDVQYFLRHQRQTWTQPTLTVARDPVMLHGKRCHQLVIQNGNHYLKGRPPAELKALADRLTTALGASP